MVRVKRGGVFVTVPKGKDVSTFGRSGGSSSSRRASQQDQINKVLADMRAGRISQVDAAATVKNIQRGGGSGRAADPRLFAAAQEALRKAEAQRLVNESIAREKAAAKLESTKVQTEFKKILDARARIIGRGGRSSVTNSVDFKTRDKLKITTWKLGGNTVRRVENLTQNTIKYNRFAPGRGGGSVRFQGGITKGATPKQEKSVEIDLNDLSPSQAIALANAGFTRKDIENWGERLTGLERIHAGTKTLAKRLIGKLERGENLGSKDKLTLLILQFGIPSQQLIIGLKQLPNFAKSIKDDPKLLLTLPGQMWDGLKQSGAEIIALGKVSPSLAIVRIGGELILMFGIGAGFKVLGKVTVTMARKISPFLKPIKGGSLILKTATRKGIAKIKIVSKNTGVSITKKYKVIRKIKKVRVIAKAAKEVEINKFKSAVEFSKGLKQARRIRKLARKKGRTINIGDRDFIEAVARIEDFADDFARLNADDFITKFKARGGKLGIGQEEAFIKAVRKLINDNLKKNSLFKTLKNNARLSEPFQIKLLKAGKISTAKKITNGLSSYINKIPIVKQMKKIINSIKKSKIRKALKRNIKKGIKKSEILKQSKISKFKSAVEFSKELKQARRIRKLARKKGRTINIGNTDYMDAIASIEQQANNIGFARARVLLNKFKSSGGKLGLGQEEQFIKAVQKFVNQKLKELPDYKKLVEAARLNKPFQIKLIKIGKIKRAKIMLNDVKLRINKLSIVKKVNSIFNKIKRITSIKDLKEAGKGFKRIRKLGKRAKSSEIKRFQAAVLKRAALKQSKKLRKITFKQARRIRKLARKKTARRIKRQLKKIKKTSESTVKRRTRSIRFDKRTSRRISRISPRTKVKILNQRKLRSINFQDIEKINNFRRINSVVDTLFDEVAKRQKLNLNPAKYRALKNIVKKKLIKAVKNNNVAEINKFKAVAKNMIEDMNKPSAQPLVRIIQKTGKSKRIRTIKNFKPDTPKGSFVEVKSGQHVLLQEVRQVQKQVQKQAGKKVQKQVQKQVFVIQSVQKQSISLASLVKFAAVGLSIQAVKQLSRQKSKTISKQGKATRQGVGQKIKSLQKTSPALKTLTAQDIASAQRSKQRSGQKTKQVQIQKKTKGFTLRLPKGFSKRNLKNKTPIFFVKIKRSGKIVNLTPRALTLNDAKDFLAYRIDHGLSRSGWFEPLGDARKAVSLPKSMRGYFGRNRGKLRAFKIRVGKKRQIRNGFIEKIKFNLDKKSEVRALARAKRIAKLRRGGKKPIKRKPIKRKRTKKRK